MRTSTDISSIVSTQFPDLDDQQLLDELIEYAKIHEVKQGDLVLDYGDRITAVPLVLDGSLKISRLNEKEQEVFLYYITTGETCATSFSCCLVKKRSEIMAVAETDSKILFVPLELVNDWMAKYSAWRNFVFNSYDQRLFGLIDTVDRLAFSKLDDQLMDYLERTAMNLQSNKISTTHQKIAMDLNVSREAVSRLLKKLEKKGVIELARNQINLLNEKR